MCGEHQHLLRIDPERITVVREDDTDDKDSLRCLLEVELDDHLKYESVRVELVLRDERERVLFRDDNALDMDYHHGAQLTTQTRFYVEKALLDKAARVQLRGMARIIAVDHELSVPMSAVEHRRGSSSPW
ncbi:MAG: hypothetical protein RBU37_27065 [Myxococcota bacterium]|jgi:methylaspartate ammonia-lyase|nr:hypothetical protein [Myxococcota bacterium]